jgi:hypothetical protein
MFPASYQHLRPSNVRLPYPLRLLFASPAHASFFLSQGYAPLFSDFDSFYTRRLKLRIEDCFSRPVTGVASRTATCIDRTPTDHFADFVYTGETTQALNVSSYNYLGFAQSRGPCADFAEDIVRKMGITTAGSRNDVGTSDLHIQTERLVAEFVGAEDSMIVSMGFATNSTTLPALLSKGCLVISDELNHSSIRFGARLSGAMVRQYKHNDMEDLEGLLREAISQGQPRTHRPWKKILLIVEGLYSMEGTLVDLPRILELKDIYKVRSHLSSLSPPCSPFLVAVLPLHRRSSLCRCSRPARSWSVRLFRCGPSPRRHSHGNLHQVFVLSLLYLLPILTFLLPQPSVPPVDTSPVPTSSSPPFASTRTLRTTPNRCPPSSSPKSPRRWEASWVPKRSRSCPRSLVYRSESWTAKMGRTG